MIFWIETALKGLVLLAMLALDLATTALYFIGTLGNGGATVAEPFSWTAQVVLTVLWITVVAVAWYSAGWAWRGIELRLASRST